MTTHPRFLPTLDFTFVIKRLPHVSYYGQSATLPGVNIGSVVSGTPFRPLQIPGDKMEFEDLSISFKVDENMENYNEIFNWMVGLTFPKQFEQYANLSKGPGVYSDASVIVLSGTRLPLVEYRFVDVFPINLSGIEIDTRKSDTEQATATATFKVNSFQIVPITS